MYEMIFSSGEIFTEKFRGEALERAKRYISGLPATPDEIDRWTKEIVCSYYSNLDGGGFECDPFVKVYPID